MLNEPIELVNLSIPDCWKDEITEIPYGKMLKLSGEKVKAWVIMPIPVPVEPVSNVTTVTPNT